MDRPEEKAHFPLPLRGAFIGLASLFVLTSACATAVEVARPATTSAGRLQLVGGVRVLTLRGTPRQRGEAHGRLLGAQVRAVVKLYVRGFLSRVMGGWGNAMAVARAAEGSIPRTLRQELRGLARAARVSYDELLVLNAHVDALASGCSSITVQAPASASGRVLLARNLDWSAPAGMQDLAVLMVVHGPGGRAFASYTYPGFLGVLTAVNDAGVAVSMNVSQSRDRARRCHPTPLLIRSALRRAATAEELLKHMVAGKRCSGFLITAADARTGGRVLEMTAGRTALRLPVAGLLLSTNHFRTTAMRPLQGMMYANSMGRLLSLQRWLGRRPTASRVGEASLWRALRKAPVKNRGTIMTVIVDPAKLRMRVWERGSRGEAGLSVDLRRLLRPTPKPQ